MRNPYDLSRSPAGSSGGSAAGVAASLAMAALGTDTGNSVRGPASHTGVVGLRPSLGLTSRAGLVPLRVDRDTSGPLARTVEDVVRLLEVMAVPDPADPISRLAAGVRRPESYTQFLRADGLEGARVGVLRQIAQLPGADPGIQRLFGQALRALQRAGAVLVDDFSIVGNSLGPLSWQADKYGEGPAVGDWNVAGLGWVDLWADQSTIREGIDGYLVTANTSTNSLAAIYAAGLYHPASTEELAAVLRATPPPTPSDGSPTCGSGWLWEDACRMEFRRRLVDSMDAQNISVLVYPTWTNLPFPALDLSPGPDYGGNASPMIAPHTGAPAMTVPMGFAGDAGLPVGLSFIARPFGEPELIAAAYAYEQATRLRQPPPLFPECSDPPSRVSGAPAG